MLNIKKLTFYNVNDDYIKYLRKFDSKVLYNKPDNQRRHYVGFVLKINDISYLVPLSSKIRKKNDVTTIIPNIFTEKQKLEADFDTKYPKYIASIKFNNMIPVYDKVIEKIDLSELAETEDGLNYNNLLGKEIIYCNENKDNIIKKANKTYEMCKK